MTDIADDGPLAGVIVADLSRVLAGPYCTMLLADMGALVIKVESPRGDDTRAWAPPRLGEESTYFLSVNRNKYSIALDLKDAEHRAIARRIIDRSDVLVENFKPGGLSRLGLGHDALSATHPGLVHASITGFGTGPGADLPGYDLLAQAVSGIMDLTGRADGEPMRAGVAFVDVMTGLHAAIGILAALHERERTGLGQHIEVNLLSSALSGLVNQSGAYAAAGVVPTRMGNEHPTLHPYEPFATRDKQIVVAVGNDAQFAALCGCLGLPELARDPRYLTNAARNEHRQELRAALAERLRERDAEEWLALLAGAGVPAAPILDLAGGAQLAEDLGLEPIVLAGAGERRIPTIRHPIGFSRSAVDYSQAPPLLDGDRARVLRWLATPGTAFPPP